MEHPYIDDEHLVDRYLAGELSDDEVERFEEHLFACEDCLEAVEWGEELRRGLHDVAAEPTATDDAEVIAPAPWLSHLLTARTLLPATLAVACLVLGALTLFQRAELLRLHAAGVGTAQLAEPTADFSVVSLGVVRDGAPAEVHLDPGKNAVLFSLELPNVGSALYAVTLFDAAGSVLWRGEGLQPSLYDSLMVAVPSSLLSPGMYRIAVEDLPASVDGPLGEIEFRVVANR